MSDSAAAETKKKRSCARIFLKLIAVLFVIVVLAVTAAGFGAYLIYAHVTGKGAEGPPVRVEIPSGVTGTQAAKILEDAGLVEYKEFFRLAVRLDTVKKPIVQGLYDIPQGYSPTEILHMLQEGPNVSASGFRITVPEGLTIKQVVKELARQHPDATHFKDPEAFIRAASNPELIRELGIDAPTLEGFLMPDTYLFDDEPTPEEVVGRMVEHFKSEYEALVKEIPAAAQRDKLEVVTIASLVEEESKVNDERPTVAAVIANRVQKKMPLDFDSTLQFALDKYGQRLLDSDKQVDSPYNTYRNAGLPPGPISSPGVESLRAALQPAQVDYLFFVSNADGKTHTFSATLEEHNKAVAKYRREIAIQRKEQEAARAAEESGQ
ncbi:MAG: endolytic transglycosylase MltG [Candidatus Hydrogenedentes bacterium]|nr:endolytic transglycosylase MltG [Candidatus Hydrogenedentota bacterium]